jgi:integrase
MGHYKDDRANTIIDKANADKFIATPATKTKQERDKFLLRILYLTGARPYELTLLKRKDFTWDKDYIYIKIYNAKLGKVRHFVVHERILSISKDSVYVPEVIDYVSKIEEPEYKLLNIIPRRMRQIVELMSSDTVCPYTFRHSRLWTLAGPNATIPMLMDWKGAEDVRSISAYLKGKKNPPVKID